MLTAKHLPWVLGLTVLGAIGAFGAAAAMPDTRLAAIQTSLQAQYKKLAGGAASGAAVLDDSFALAVNGNGGVFRKGNAPQSFWTGLSSNTQIVTVNYSFVRDPKSQNIQLRAVAKVKNGNNMSFTDAWAFNGGVWKLVTRIAGS
jgi:hypothetical protein